MGGSVREWGTQIQENIVPGSRYTLDLVMTKFEGGSVMIGYDVSFR